MTRPPHAASSVVGYASDTASAVAKVEPNANRSRETGRPYYLNQCWNFVNWTLGNKFQRNLNRNSCIFIQENVFENFVWKMVAILSRPQCVKQKNRCLVKMRHHWMYIDCQGVIVRANQSWDSTECYRKLISPGKAHQAWEYHNEITHQIWAQPNQWFVCKCMETIWSIRCHKMVEIQLTNQKLDRHGKYHRDYMDGWMDGQAHSYVFLGIHWGTISNIQAASSMS